MAQKVARLGIKRDNDYMYFVKKNTVWRVKRKKKGVRKFVHQKVARFDHKMDSDYMYFLDGKGDVSRAKRGRGRRRRKRR